MGFNSVCYIYIYCVDICLVNIEGNDGIFISEDIRQGKEEKR